MKLRIETSQQKFWRLTGSSDLGELLNYVIRLLGEKGISTLVIGGLAVQNCGLERYTSDIDLVVSDLEKAKEELLSLGFHEGGTSRMFCKVLDPQESWGVDLLSPGHHEYGGVVDIPTPTEVVKTPKYIDLAGLLSLKLSSYERNGSRRSQDFADVTRLIRLLKLPKDFHVDPKVQKFYEETWEDLFSEPGDDF